MIGNGLETEIIEIFREDITRLLSINQIAKKLGKSYPYIHKKVNEFIDEGIFKTKKIGNSILCTINLQNEEARAFLIINEVLHKKKVLKNNPEIKNKLEEIEELKEKNHIWTVIQNSNHTIIISEEKKEFKGFKVLNKEEFQQQVFKDYSLIKDHTILYHHEEYYEIIGEIEDKLRNKQLMP